MRKRGMFWDGGRRSTVGYDSEGPGTTSNYAHLLMADEETVEVCKEFCNARSGFTA